MKVVKSIIFSAVVSFIGCKSAISSISVPKGSEQVISVSPKKGVLSEDEMHSWSYADLEKDSIAGISIEKAYAFLEGKKGVKVIVAIADSGVDIDHKDLKDVAWIHPEEVADNGIDDDKNGYTDDLHGWNFLGNKEGKMVVKDQLEITRIVKKGTEKFGDKKATEILENDKIEFQNFLKLKEEYQLTIQKNSEEIETLNETLQRLSQIEENFTLVRKLIGKEVFTEFDLKALRPTSISEGTKIADVSSLLKRGMKESEMLAYKKEVLAYKEHQEKAQKGYDFNLNNRQNLGDNLEDITDKYYGNHNVIGSKELEKHGTHVAGIVAASRSTNSGMKGIANNVQIMTVRVVPDGDEHDKDVALGIRYAVDNGAKIINTSFGKRFSPNKEWVFEAIKYAAEKEVLIVNAAGNDGKNIDIRHSYPSDSKDLVNEFADNVITIGASSVAYNENLPATFSNYGKINVDVFAPGVAIYSTVPKDKYEALSGTSMAAPTVAGIAALIRSYYPQLSASQVKHILMNSGTKINFDVIKPGTKDEKVPFTDLSVSGRVVNAYNAIKMADRMVKGKK